jgi:hypothetical protein
MCIHVLCIWNSGVAQSLTKTGAAWRIDTKLRLSLETKGRLHVVPTTTHPSKIGAEKTGRVFVAPSQPRARRCSSPYNVLLLKVLSLYCRDPKNKQ